jgi:hypothetical protein
VVKKVVVKVQKRKKVVAVKVQKSKVKQKSPKFVAKICRQNVLPIRSQKSCCSQKSCRNLKVVVVKPVERGSPLGWPAGGGQLGLAAVSFLHSLS